MGEAKRRKKIDPSYGTYTPSIWIEKSDTTNNFLIVIEFCCIDSTIHYNEAEAIKEWLLNEFKLRRFRGVFQEKDLTDWILSSPRLKEYPTTTAEVMVLDMKTGLAKVKLVTVSGDNIVQQAVPTNKTVWLDPNNIPQSTKKRAWEKYKDYCLDRRKSCPPDSEERIYYEREITKAQSELDLL